MLDARCWMQMADGRTNALKALAPCVHIPTNDAVADRSVGTPARNQTKTRRSRQVFEKLSQGMR